MVEKTRKKRIVLLDAHAIIHRAYHGLPDFASSSGEPTGALYGVSTMLLRIAAEFKPDHIVACYDLPKPTFRHIAHAGYKAGRQKTDDALATQLGTSREIFEAFSVPIYEHPGFEADDILGTIVKKLKDDTETEIIIASGDMDTMQLIDGTHVRVYTLKKGINDTILYDEKAVQARFGFSPKQIPDYKGLAGDPSDNIIGITGIGDKTATNLISNFGTIENIYKVQKKDPQKILDAGVTPRMANLIKEGEDEALFSKSLATIRRDAPIDFVLEETPWIETFSIEKATKVLTKFEFKSLKSRIAAVPDIFSGKKKAEEVLGAKTSTTKKEKTEREEDKSIFTDTDFIDAQVCAWLLNADKTNPKIDDMLEISGGETFTEAYKILKDRVMSDKKLARLYSEIEAPLMPIVLRMKNTGISLDTEYLKILEKKYTEDLETLAEKIHTLARKSFNIGSPKQLAEVLFEDLHLEVKGLKKTSTGARSTNIDTLLKLKGSHPIIDLIIEYREQDKMLSTYISPLPKLVTEDGKLHSTFLQTGASTGRFSSENPNMQNIPTTLEEGKNVRKAFFATEGKVFLAFDYSQIDLRSAAMLSSDKQLQSIFKKNEDAHTAVASRVFEVEPADVTLEMRRKAKVINFGILYGMGVSALRENLGGERKDSQDFYDAYKKTFSTLTLYLEQVKVFAKDRGYTETLFGRRRPMPLLRSALPFIRAQGERMAINAPIQGTSADIMRLAIVDIQKVLDENKLGGKAEQILQIHDEVILEVDISEVEKVSKLVKGVMEDVLEKHKDMFVANVEMVPLVVSLKKGDTLGTLN